MQAKEEVVEQRLAERRSLISQNIQNLKKKKITPTSNDGSHVIANWCSKHERANPYSSVTFNSHQLFVNLLICGKNHE